MPEHWDVADMMASFMEFNISHPTTLAIVVGGVALFWLLYPRRKPRGTETDIPSDDGHIHDGYGSTADTAHLTTAAEEKGEGNDHPNNDVITKDVVANNHLSPEEISYATDSPVAAPEDATSSEVNVLPDTILSEDVQVKTVDMEPSDTIVECPIAQEDTSDNMASPEPAFENLIGAEEASDNMANPEPIVEDMIDHEETTLSMASPEPPVQSLIGQEDTVVPVETSDNMASPESFGEELIAQEDTSDNMTTPDPVVEGLIAQEDTSDNMTTPDPVVEGLIAQEETSDNMASPVGESIVAPEQTSDNMAIPESVVEELIAQEDTSDNMTTPDSVVEGLIAQEDTSDNMTTPDPVVEGLIAQEETSDNMASPVGESIVAPEESSENMSTPDPVDEILEKKESKPATGTADAEKSSDELLNELLGLTKFSLEELREWRRMFYSSNPDGKMAKEGLESMFSSMFPEGNAKRFADNVFRSYDMDGDGNVDFKEFMIGISLTSRGTLEEKLEWAFDIYDEDSSGFIEKSEVLNVITAVQEMQGKANPKKAEKLVRKMFRKFDKNEDEALSREEFIEGCAVDTSFVNLLEWD